MSDTRPPFHSDERPAAQAEPSVESAAASTRAAGEFATPADLAAAWGALRRENPGIRERDAAAALGASEAELVATAVGDGNTRLRPDWYELLPRFEDLGEVMALTRNDVFVHEKVGRYRSTRIFRDHEMGQVLDEDVDLRMFFRYWHFGFAVRKPSEDGLKRSFQFFDEHGVAVHKIHLRPESGLEHFEALVDAYQHGEQQRSVEVTLARPKETRADGDVENGKVVDRKALISDWRALEDTHDFIFLLRKHDLSRLDAFRLAGEEFAREVDTSSLRSVLERVVEETLPIMVFVGNRGCLQIHTGRVRNLKEARGWFNILDPGFSLHVKEREIAQAWVVRKPTRDGDVHSLEFFDASGDVVCYLFGERKQGRRERWPALLAELD